MEVDLSSLGVNNASMLGGNNDILGVKAELWAVDDAGEYSSLQFAQEPDPFSNNDSWVWVQYEGMTPDTRNVMPVWMVVNDTELVRKGRWVA